MLKTFIPLILLLSGVVQAQASVQSSAQLVQEAQGFMSTYLKAIASNDVRAVADMYHSGAQFKTLATTTKNTEVPDRYSNITYTVLEKQVVRISAQRQSVSRGYTVPNHLFVSPDAQGHWWIVGERGFQRVK